MRPIAPGVEDNIVLFKLAEMSLFIEPWLAMIRQAGVIHNLLVNVSRWPKDTILSNSAHWFFHEWHSLPSLIDHLCDLIHLFDLFHLPDPFHLSDLLFIG